MADRINPVRETFSPMSKAMYEFEKARNDLNADLPGIVDVIDKHEALVRLRLAMIEQQLQQRQGEREMIIKWGVAAAGVAVLFPPFHWGARGSSFGLGHSLIVAPPTIGKGSSEHGAIDGIGLLAILAGIALVTWGATLVKWRK